jgi:hypothetical protein
MFNAKALTIANRNARRSNGNNGLDRFDMEAEREGSAKRFFKSNEVKPSTLGRRISKQTRQLDGRRKTADNRAAQNLVRDTVERMQQHVLPQTQLAQR